MNILVKKQELVKKQVEQLLQKEQIRANQIEKQDVHCLRVVYFIIDMTKSMHIKDFKPSRLSVTLQMIKFYMKNAKDYTPLIKFGLAIVQNEMCKNLITFTYDTNKILECLEELKINSDSGYFSLQNTLRVSLDNFENIHYYSCRQILIIQSSALTKDYRNIYQTIDKFSRSGIRIGIISLVGWTYIFEKLINKVNGFYITVNSNEHYKKVIEEVSKPPKLIKENIEHCLVKMTLCRKQFNRNGVQCYCHLRITHNYYVCTICEAISCTEPSYQCQICDTIVILPTDLSRHKI